MPTVNPNLGFKADAKVINLAQKVFRKNAQTVDSIPGTSGQLETIQVQTTSELQSGIDKRNQELLTYVTDKLPYERWIYCDAIAMYCGWTDNNCLDKVDDAKHASEAALNSMP